MKTELFITSYGVQIGIRLNDSAILESLLDYLPPGYQLSPPCLADYCYSLTVHNLYQGFYYQLCRAEEKLLETTDLEEALDAFDSDLRLQIAIAARDQLFVHAGVVGWQGKAILIPGRSFSGKTTLVSSLVKAGAIYYSDEYAVFDTNGQVYPYPKPLSIRQFGQAQVKKRCSAQELGGKIGTEPITVGLIIHTQYNPKAKWNPIQISSGQSMLALLDNTIIARLRPDFALPILVKAVSNALSFEGERGSADRSAMALLQGFSELAPKNWTGK